MQIQPCDVAARPRILVVEDNSDLAFGLLINLELEGYDVIVAGDGVSAIELIAVAQFDLILLDLMLPIMTGYGVLEKLRVSQNTTPVIVLSAKLDEIDRVSALRCGADDYVCKPFSLLELMERVRIQLRRRSVACSDGRRTDREIWIGSARIDLEARVVNRDTEQSNLRPKEFDLLMSLWHELGAVISKDQLLKRVWGYKSKAETRTLDFHVGTLRAKLEANPSQPRHLLTVRGVGYRLIA